MTQKIIMAYVLGIGLGLAIPRFAQAHCDTMDGPVVTAAKAALAKGDVTPVLRWVKPEHEQDIRKAFRKTMAVRDKGPQAKELADMYFFETLVRIHRAGEGAPYAGLKDEPVEPIVALADKALEGGSADEMIQKVTAHVAESIRAKFNKALEAKKHANESVPAGREFVEAYVEYVHSVEGIHNAASGLSHHEAEAGENHGGHAD